MLSSLVDEHCETAGAAPSGKEANNRFLRQYNALSAEDDMIVKSVGISAA
jgi:hypothetical protein